MNNLEKAAEFGSAMGKMFGSVMNKRVDLGTKPGVGEIEKVVKPAPPPVNPGVALERPQIVQRGLNHDLIQPAVLGAALTAGYLQRPKSLPDMAVKGAIGVGKYISNANKAGEPLMPDFRGLKHGLQDIMQGRPAPKRKDAGKG